MLRRGIVKAQVEEAIRLALQGHGVAFFAVGFDVPALWRHRAYPPGVSAGKYRVFMSLAGPIEA